MGKRDTITKNYMRRPEIFADVFNQFLYHGRQKILPDRLIELDTLLPVVTLVVYFGAEEWDGPLSLKEMYADTDEEILKYAADYRVNLIAPRGLSDRELDEFHTSFREVMKFIKYSSDGQRLATEVSADERFKSVERQAVEVINAVTGSKVKCPKRKEEVDMCAAIQEIREEGRLEGEIIGVIRSDKRRGVSKENTVQYLMEEYQKSEAEADDLIRLYWK